MSCCTTATNLRYQVCEQRNGEKGLPNFSRFPIRSVLLVRRLFWFARYYDDKCHVRKQGVKGRVCFSFPASVHHRREARAETQAGMWRQQLSESGTRLLACSLAHDELHIYTAQAHLARDKTVHSVLAWLSYIN